MSDMRTETATAIAAAEGRLLFEDGGPDVWLRSADAAIAAATPFIEAALIRRIARNLHESADALHRDGLHDAGAAIRAIAQGIAKEAGA